MAVRLEWTSASLADLDRLDVFLRDKSPRASADAIDTILESIFDVLAFPFSGRPLSPDDEDPYRELIVPFSHSGYVVLYKFDGSILEIQSIKHMREAGY